MKTRSRHDVGITGAETSSRRFRWRQLERASAMMPDLLIPPFQIRPAVHLQRRSLGSTPARTGCTSSCRNWELKDPDLPEKMTISGEMTTDEFPAFTRSFFKVQRVGAIQFQRGGSVRTQSPSRREYALNTKGAAVGPHPWVASLCSFEKLR